MTARGSRLRAHLLAAAVLFGGVPAALRSAPTILGPSKCTSCHDHDKQAAWAPTDTHSKALTQLDDKKAAGYAKAIGLADPYDLKGACVRCHATIFNGDANAGVSCETCHGPGSDYVQPHQEKGTHARSITLGLFDTRGNPSVWAKMCVDCHVMKDAKLIAAGHKSGADFDVGVSSQKIVHWVPPYDFAKLSALGKSAAPAAGKPPAAPAPAAAPAPKAEAPKPAPTAPPPPPAAPKAAAAPAPTMAAPKAAPVEPHPTPPPAAPAPPSAPPPAATAAATAAPPTPIPPPPPAAVVPEAKPAPPAASPAVVIEIRATPIPPRPPTAPPAPREVKPNAAEPAPAAAAPAPPGAPPPPPTKRPSPRRKPSQRPTPASTAAATPAPAAPAGPPPTNTVTPTRRPAPPPPQRAPN